MSYCIRNKTKIKTIIYATGQYNIPYMLVPTQFVLEIPLGRGHKTLKSVRILKVCFIPWGDPITIGKPLSCIGNPLLGASISHIRSVRQQSQSHIMFFPPRNSSNQSQCRHLIRTNKADFIENCDSINSLMPNTHYDYVFSFLNAESLLVQPMCSQRDL